MHRPSTLLSDYLSKAFDSVEAHFSSTYQHTRHSQNKCFCCNPIAQKHLFFISSSPLSHVHYQPLRVPKILLPQTERYSCETYLPLLRNTCDIFTENHTTKTFFQKRLFCVAKVPILPRKRAYIAMQNSPFYNAKA